MELVLQSIDLVMIVVEMRQHLEHDQFLVLHLMLVKIVHQHKHLKMVEWLEYGQYRDEQLHKKLSRKKYSLMKNVFFEINLFTCLSRIRFAITVAG